MIGQGRVGSLAFKPALHSMLQGRKLPPNLFQSLSLELGQHYTGSLRQPAEDLAPGSDK